MKKIKEGQKQNCSCGIYSKDRVHSPSICFPNPSPKKELCPCHKSGHSCTGCELGTECESMVHFERIKPSKSKESWKWELERDIFGKHSYLYSYSKKETLEKTIEWISDLLLKQREENIQKIRKEFVLNYDKLTLKQFDDILKGLKKE